MDDRNKPSCSYSVAVPPKLPKRSNDADASSARRNIPLVDLTESDDDEDPSVWTRYRDQLMELFPGIQLDYLKNHSARLDANQENLANLINVYLEEGYEKIDFDNCDACLVEDVPGPTSRKSMERKTLMDHLSAMFPKADPSYLDRKLASVENSSELYDLIEHLYSHSHPTRADYNKKLEREREAKPFKEDFTVEGFLKLFPDPVAYFANASRKSDYEFSFTYLKFKYTTKRVKDLVKIMRRFKGNLTLSHNYIEGNLKKLRDMKSPRAADVIIIPQPLDDAYIPFLQEVAFIENRARIEETISNKKREKELAFEAARSRGELLSCDICFDNEVMPCDMARCNSGHPLCKVCVKTAMINDISENKTTLRCYTHACNDEYNLPVAQELLDARMFTRFALKKASEEINAAGLEDLANCPFCEFANIAAPDDKIFRCLNPDCSKESCRLCGEESHIPLRCEEIEKPKEVKVRTFIEAEMTNALVRVCYRCKQKFIKEEGCNKMTCGCGATMCYICRQPVNDYSHFNGMGGIEFDKCPLFSDTKALHRESVEIAAKKAKKDALEENPGTVLKHDPTVLLPQNSSGIPPMGNALLRMPPIVYPAMGLPPIGIPPMRYPPAGNPRMRNHAPQ